MSNRPVPDWFSLCEEATPETMARVSTSLQNLSLPLQVRFLPMQSHWFVLDSLLLSNRANREGMHAAALALTRQCIEAMSVIELGLSQSSDAGATLVKWDADELTPGALRKWLSEYLWSAYGCGLWTESWADFMGHLAKAIQPYAHYTPHLAKWQLRLHGPMSSANDDITLLVEYKPRAYDPQKATRITLFHAILTFSLARIWLASNADLKFSSLIDRLRMALGESKYLDGHETDWDQQFWATLWSQHGGTILE